MLSWFRVAERGSSLRVEIAAGVSTFVAMAYIAVVNPAILEAAGLPIRASTTATIVVAAAGSILMGLWANRPIAVAPYMGENAFIAFSLTGLGVTWQQRLGSVFVAGLVFLLITLFGVRGWLARAVSPSLKFSFAAGIGLFLACIGMNQTGLVQAGAGTPVRIGDVASANVLLAIATFVVMMVLLYHRVRGAILIGMLAAGIAGLALGMAKLPGRLVALPFSGEYSLAPIALELDVAGVLRLSFLPVLLTLVLMSFLDTLGTLVGVGAAGNMLDQRGEFPQIERPMLVDALACIGSGLVGTSTSGAYVESAVGIREGGRTGIAAIVTGLLFALSLFFVPLLAPLQQLSFAYGPALIVVGALMLEAVRKVDFEDVTEAVPAFATIAMMVFTYNIANGLTAGLILHPLMKLFAGRVREVPAASVVLALLCVVYYVYGLPH